MAMWAWCVAESELQAWCAAAGDAAQSTPPWEAHEPAPWPTQAEKDWSASALYLLSLLPLVVLLSHRASASYDLLPLPLAAAAACVTPGLMLSPAAGMLASVGLNTLLLLHIQRLRVDAEPPAVSRRAASPL